MMMNKLVPVGYVLLGGVAGGMLVWVAQGHTLRIWPDKIAYADLIAVLLTGTSLIVAILGIFLALMALWGYTQFRKMVRKAVEDITPSYLVREIKEGGSKSVLVNIVAEIVRDYQQDPTGVEQWVAERSAKLAKLGDLDKDSLDE